MKYYTQVAPLLNEPPVARPVAPMLKLRRKHTYGGVTGLAIQGHAWRGPSVTPWAYGAHGCLLDLAHFLFHKSLQIIFQSIKYGTPTIHKTHFFLLFTIFFSWMNNIKSKIGIISIFLK